MAEASSTPSTPTSVRDARQRAIDQAISMADLCNQIADTLEAYAIQPSDVINALLA